MSNNHLLDLMTKFIRNVNDNQNMEIKMAMVGDMMI